MCRKPHPCCLRSRNCDEEFDWDAFTLSCGFVFLIFGLVCCAIQIASILQDYILDCYAVGLWCSAGFLITGVLAIVLYMNDRVAPVSLMTASVVCDLAFGVVLAMAGAAVSAQCVPGSHMFIGVVLACVCGILTGTVHAGLFIGEIIKLRLQLHQPKRSGDFMPGFSRAVAQLKSTANQSGYNNY